MSTARDRTAVRSTQLEPARLVAASRADCWVDKPGSRTSMGCGGAAPEAKRSWLHRRQREVGHGDALGHVVEDNLDRCAEGQVTRLGVHQPGDHAQPLRLLELDLGPGNRFGRASHPPPPPNAPPPPAGIGTSNTLSVIDTRA